MQRRTDLTCDDLVLIVTEDSPESHSPAGERIRHLASAVGSIFGKSIILALGASKKQKRTKISAGTLLYGINLKTRLPYPVSAFFDPMKFLLFLMYGLLLSLRYSSSLVIASMPPWETGLSSWIVAKLLRRKLVIDLRDDWESAAMESRLAEYVPAELIMLRSRIAKNMYSFSSTILAITPTLVDGIRKRGINPTIVLAPNGADTSKFYPRREEMRKRIRSKHGLPTNRIIVIYCGSGINPYYRLDLILESLKSLPDSVRERTFFVFYVYNGMESLRKFKDNLGLPDSLIEIREPLSRDKIAEVMSACDIGLVPFDDEPYLLYATSTKVYEYISSGLYVVCSGPNGGELDSMISAEPNNGVFVSPRVEDLVEAVSNAVGSLEYLFSNSRRSVRYTYIDKNYDRRKTMVTAVEKLVTEVWNPANSRWTFVKE